MFKKLKNISVKELVEKMWTVNQHEKNHFYLEYQRYCFLNGRSKKIENIISNERKIMGAAFSKNLPKVLLKKDIGDFINSKS
jgi:hypothetical protein